MPSGRGNRGGPTLPVTLRQELGLSDGRKRNGGTQIADRKQRRQDTRKQQRGSGKYQQYRRQQPSLTDDRDEVSLGKDEDEEDEHEIDDRPVKRVKREQSQPTVSKQPAKRQRPSPSPSLSPELEHDSGLDNPFDESDDEGNLSHMSDDSDDLSRGSREYSPEIVLDANSKSYVDRQAAEDEEILALERKLGGKNGKVFDDGFDDLLIDVEGALGGKKSKSTGSEWLKEKRAKALAKQGNNAAQLSINSEDDQQVDEVSDSGDEDEFIGFEDNSSSGEGSLTEDQGSKEDLSDDEEAKETPEVPPRRVRENPYVAPTVNVSTDTAQKYIPPSRRLPPSDDAEKRLKLKRQAQGSLNKLSEANMVSIVDEFEKLYLSNPRQDVTDVLIDLLLSAFAIPSALQNTFIILHAAFVAAIYKVQGPDFAATLLTRLVECFDNYHANQQDQAKQALNLTSLLANLFTFGVVTNTLVYDHVRLLLSDFSENNAELLLRVMRDCGPQLRSDNPAALKGIVQLMNEVTAKMTSAGKSINIRTHVMMDTITDLKNNKIRQATNAAGATGEHLTRMRKALGSLNNRQLKATEPMGISRADILNTDKKGKWWLVGASWKGRDGADVLSQELKPIQKQKMSDESGIDYPALFAHYKLTSPVHRSIFVALTSSVDATDALERLNKLRLNRKQELEIPPVILKTCRAESKFNPYYGAISKMLLREKRYRMSFSIALWKFFEALGEKQQDPDQSGDEDDDSNLEDIQVLEIANVAQLYAYLIAKRALTLDVLKTLDIGMTKENASLFLELFFIALFDQNLDEEKIVDLFSSGVDPARSKSVAYLLKKNVQRSDLLVDKRQKHKVKTGVRMAVAALSAMERGDMVLDDAF